MSDRFMDENTTRPCWNITAWALIGFVLVVFAIALMSGSGSEVVANVQPLS